MSDTPVQDSLAATKVTATQLKELLHGTDQNEPDNILMTTLALRFKMVETLLETPALLVADPKLTGNVRGLLDSIDKQTLTVQKQKQEKEIASASNESILVAFAALTKANGRHLTIGNSDGVLVDPSRTFDHADVALPTDEFTFADAETIVGNDTENSLL